MVGQGRAWQAMVGQGWARAGRAGYGRAEQGRTELRKDEPIDVHAGMSRG